jgi:hypothetical protein
MQHILALCAAVLSGGSLSFPETTIPELAATPSGAGSASDTGPGDLLGLAIDRSGDTVIVGARNHDLPGAQNAGAAYVFVRQGTDWTQQAKLTASDGQAGDQFGVSVAVDGDLAVVGAWRDDPQLTDSGSAYVFERVGTTWVEIQRLMAGDAFLEDYFGRAVAVAGGRILVGAIGDDNELGTDAGAVYAFERNGLFMQTEKFLAEGQPGAWNGLGFGRAIAMTEDGDSAAIGALRAAGGVGYYRAYVAEHNGDSWGLAERLGPFTSLAEGSPEGATPPPELDIDIDRDRIVFGGVSFTGLAVVYERSESGWDDGTHLLLDATPAFEAGVTVAVSGETVVVGARGASPGGSSAGFCYLFRRAGTQWCRSGLLPGTQDDDRFGSSLTLDEDGRSLIVGVPTEAVAIGGAFRSYELELRQPRWGETAHMEHDGSPHDQFGTDIAASGNTLLVGAPTELFESDNPQGRAYVLERTGSGWSDPIQLPDLSSPWQRFGSAVALDGDRALVAAPRWIGPENPPSVHVYARNGGAFQLETILSSGGAFGTSVDLRGDRALIASGSGVDVYERETTWTQVTWLSGPPQIGFGRSVALGDEWAFVGAPTSSLPGETQAGVVYVYRRDGTSWTNTQVLSASDPYFMAEFGTELDCDGDLLAVTAPDVPVPEVQIGRRGASYVFRLEGQTWVEEAKLHPMFDTGAQSVALRDERLLVGLAYGGAPCLPGIPPFGALSRTGKACVFERTPTGWVERVTLYPEEGENGDWFGTSVAWVGKSPAVGAPNDSTSNGTKAGTVRVFREGGRYPSFCNGTDGALAACPCGAPGGFDTGCDLAQGTGGVRLDVVQQESTPNTRATLTGVGFPESTTPTAIVLRGISTESSAAVFGAGLRCLALPVARRGAAFATGGSSTHVVGQELSSTIAYYQLWFRSLPQANCASSGFSLSNGRVVHW